MNIEEIKRAVEVVENWEDIGLTILRNNETEKTLKILKDLASLVVGASEMMPPKKDFVDSCGVRLDGRWENDAFEIAKIKSNNETLEEVTLTLSKKLLGLEEFISLKLSQLCIDDKPDNLGFTKSGVLSQSLTEYLTK